MSTTPPIRRVLETALYVKDLERARLFYEGVLGLSVLFGNERLVAIDAGGGSVLLLFLQGGTAEGADADGGWIPSHDGEGPVHFALAIDADAYEPWCEHLGAAGVEIESEVGWGRGGRSIYFRDPDGHSVELVTPGVWAIY